MRFLLMFVLVVGFSSTYSRWKPKYNIPKNALTCDVCKALMTGIGEYIQIDSAVSRLSINSPDFGIRIKNE